MGLPFLTVVLAENQAGVARGLEQAGTSGSLGWAHGLTEQAVADAAGALIADRELRGSMARKGRALVDGQGAARVVEIMEAS
jgi:spore coat polysaccharide biosynthesis predicted glycosyltransferase SpsG